MITYHFPVRVLKPLLKMAVPRPAPPPSDALADATLAPMAQPAAATPAATPAAAAVPTAAASSTEGDAAATGPSGQLQQELHAATSEMLAKMTKYVEGEAELSTEDYRLLQAMNITAADKYSEMAGYAAGLVAFAEQLDGKYRELAPQLAQIDAMESQVGLTATPTQP